MARVLRPLQRTQRPPEAPVNMRVEVLKRPFPMVRRLGRRRAHARDVFVWDVDKTYLDSGFESRRELLRTAFERARDKRSMPGTAELLRALRRADSGDERGLYFITASPPQIATAIEGKLALDGVQFDGICYKNQLRLAARREFDQLRVQIAFKLAALLLLFAELADDTRFSLFGDDVEHDPLIYAMFADVAGGRLRGGALRDVLADLGVRPRYVVALREFADPLPVRECVDGLYIHLVRDPSGARLGDYDARVCGWPSSGAAAAVLAARGLLRAEERAMIEGASDGSKSVWGPQAVDPAGWWIPPARR